MPDVNKINPESAIAYQRAQQARQGAPARASRSSGESTPAPAVRTDSVSLSSGGQELRRLTDAALAAPDVRSDRVAELRAQIEAGSYEMPSDEALARAILRGG